MLFIGCVKGIAGSLFIIGFCISVVGRGNMLIDIMLFHTQSILARKKKTVQWKLVELSCWKRVFIIRLVCGFLLCNVLKE